MNRDPFPTVQWAHGVRFEGLEAEGPIPSTSGSIQGCRQVFRPQPLWLQNRSTSEFLHSFAHFRLVEGDLGGPKLGNSEFAEAHGSQKECSSKTTRPERFVPESRAPLWPAGRRASCRSGWGGAGTSRTKLFQTRRPTKPYTRVTLDAVVVATVP